MIVLVTVLLLAFEAPEAAKARARDAIRTNPLDPQIETLLQQAIAAAPNDPEGHYLYGQWALLNHQEELAIREETRAVALSPDNQVAAVQAWTLVGIAEDVLDRESAARAAFEKARIANSRLPRPDSNTLFEYAKFLHKHGDSAAAGRINAQVLKIDSRFGAAHLLEAKLLEKSGDAAGAIAAAETALTLARDPEEQRAAHAYLARAYFAAGNAEKAQVHREWVEKHGSAR